MAKAKREEVQIEEAQVQDQSKKLSVLVLEESLIRAILDVIMEKPAKEVFGVVTEINSQLQSQAEIVKFVKEAEVQESQA